MKRKPILGERLFALNVGNAARNTPQILTPVIVSKVGRKYFTVENEVGGWKQPRQFHIEEWRQVTQYTPDYVIYETEQHRADEHESLELARVIRNEFSDSWRAPKQSLETLRKIHALIKLETK